MEFRSAQEFFRAGGGLGPDHPSYIDRAADHELYSKLLAGECTCILDARQMGKTSLKNAAKERLAAQGVLLLSVDLALIGGHLAPDQWYCSLLQEFARGLEEHEIRPPEPVRNYWVQNEHWAPAYRFLRGIEELLLKPALVPGERLAKEPSQLSREPKPDPVAPPVRLILAIDEIDKVRDFAGTWSDDFFEAIRAFYEKRPVNPIHRQAGFLLIGVAPPSELFKGANSTPFNIGHRIVLTDFTRREAAKLEKGFTLLGQSPAGAAKLLDAVMAYTGGHPYLTQRLCFQAALMLAEQFTEGQSRRELRPSRLIQSACRRCFLDPGVGSNSADDNLRNVHLQLTKRLDDDRYVISHLTDRGSDRAPTKEKPATTASREERRAAVLKLYDRVLRGKQVRDDFRSNPWIVFLHFAGIVRSDQGRLRVRNRVYREVFDRHWVQENLPDSFHRAEMAAFMRGLGAASNVAVLVVLLMVLGWVVSSQNRERKAAAAENDLRAAQRPVEDPEHVTLALDAIERAADSEHNRHLLRKNLIDALSWDRLDPILPSMTSLTRTFRGWDEATVHNLDLSPAGYPLHWLEYSPNGVYVAAIHDDRPTCRLTVKRAEDGTAITLGEPCAHASVAFDSLGQRLAFMAPTGIVKILSLPEGHIEREFTNGQTANPFATYRLVFNPNPEKPWLAITSASRNQILIWNYEASGSTALELRPDEAMAIRDLAWDERGNRLAVIGEASSQIVCWDFQLNPTNPLQRRFNSTANDLESIAFLPGGSTLAGWGPDGFLYLWRSDGSLMSEIKVEDVGSRSRIVRLSDEVIGLASTNLLQAWRYKPPEVLRMFPVPMKMDEESFSFELDHSGRFALLACGSGLAFIDLKNGEAVGTTPQSSRFSVHNASFTPGSGDLIVCGEAGVLRWSYESAASAGPQVEHLFQYDGPLQRHRGLTAAALSDDGALLAVAHPSPGFQGLHVDLLEAEKAGWTELPEPDAWRDWIGQKLQVTNAIEPVTRIDKLQFSPDRRLLVGYGAEAHQLLAWELNAEAVSHDTPRLAQKAFGWAFSPDGHWLVTVDRAVIQLWPSQGGKLGQPTEYELPKPYRAKLEPGTAIVALTADEFLLAQPTTPHLIDLLGLNLRGNENPQVEKLTELSLPVGTRIKSLHLSQDAATLAALTEHQGHYLVRVWDLDQMNQRLKKDIKTAPLFTRSHARKSYPAEAKVRFEPMRFPFQGRPFRYEELEQSLRALSLEAAAGQEGSHPAPSTRPLFAEVAKAADSLAKPDWQRYFEARARAPDAQKKP